MNSMEDKKDRKMDPDEPAEPEPGMSMEGMEGVIWTTLKQIALTNSDGIH